MTTNASLCNVLINETSEVSPVIRNSVEKFTNEGVLLSKCIVNSSIMICRFNSSAVASILIICVDVCANISLRKFISMFCSIHAYS